MTKTIKRKIEFKIKLAQTHDAEKIFQLTQQTIGLVYPNYYPKDVVGFFKQHHNIDAIIKDIEMKFVYMLIHSNQIVGTITIKANEMTRLFVLPKFQGLGFGSELMMFSEAKIKQNFNQIELDASLPTEKIYLAKGYQTIEVMQIEYMPNEIFSYQRMVKKI